MEKIEYLYYLGYLVGAYFVTVILFDLLMRGFAPFVSSRPWVVFKILREINIKPKSNIISLGCGKSGLLHSIELNYQDIGKLTGVEYSFFPYLISKLQSIIRFNSKIKVEHATSLYRVDVRDADLIYCYLDVELVRDLGKKFKFDCRPGTQIISNGYLIPGLEAKKVMEVSADESKGRMAYLSRDRSLFKASRKKSKKENKIFFYEI